MKISFCAIFIISLPAYIDRSQEQRVFYVRVRLQLNETWIFVFVPNKYIMCEQPNKYIMCEQPNKYIMCEQPNKYIMCEQPNTLCVSSQIHYVWATK